MAMLIQIKNCLRDCVGGKILLCLSINVLLLNTVGANERPPLKIYIRDSLYYSVKTILPTHLTAPEKASKAKATVGPSLQWIPIPGSMLYARLKLEGDRTTADVVVGLENDVIHDIQGSPLPRSLLQHVTLPLPWQSPNFLPLYYGYLTILYNDHTVTRSPTSLYELVQAETPDQLIAPDPRTSVMGFGFAAWIIESFPQLTSLSVLKAKIKTMPASWDLAYSLFQKGEAALTVSYTTSLLYHRQQEDTAIKMVITPEGNPLQVFVAFKTLKAFKDPDADRLLEMLVDLPFQKALAENMWMYPVREEALTPTLLSLPRPEKTMLIHSSRQDILDRWQALIN